MCVRSTLEDAEGNASVTEASASSVVDSFRATGSTAAVLLRTRRLGVRSGRQGLGATAPPKGHLNRFRSIVL